MSSPSELKPKVVLGVAAHPDDLEFGMAGSVAKWVGEGATAYYAILTDGSKGSADRHVSSSDLIKIRRAEQQAAAKVLGVKEVFFFNYEDGCLECNLDVKKDIARVIRQVKPDVVMAMDPTMTYSVARGFVNHPDHRAAGQAALDAVFPLARDHLSFPELLAEGLEPHKTPTMLLVHFDNANYYIDISDYMDTKLKALDEHVSQIPNLTATHELLRGIAAQNGKKCGCRYAEAFVRLDIV